jgi:hypothetical protein
MQSTSVLYGIKASEGEMEGNKYSSTTFYLPAEFASTANTKAIGAVTVPYKFGDASEFQKWAHLEKSFPAAGIPVNCEFDVIVGKDAQGKDSAKLVLVGIKPSSPVRPAV